MGVTTQDIFGGGTRGEPALPGSYGVAPPGYRLPDATRLGRVVLQVSNLERSLRFYETVLGLALVARHERRALLGAQGEDRVLVELRERPNALPAGRGRLGLYHFAILLPDRPALGRFVRHLGAIGARAGAGDHLVSEAFYLSDPDGLGIEVYADRPRDAWRRAGRELMMATDPVDVDALVAAAGDTAWTGMPRGTTMGHLHLHVGAIERAASFYGDALGFDRIVWSYPGALFLGAGGYHHQLGTNTWAGPHAQPAPEREARLVEWTIELPTQSDVDAAAVSLSQAGHAPTREEDDAVARDPWGTAVRLTVG